MSHWISLPFSCRGEGLTEIGSLALQLLPVAYALGMAFLPKQYAQERKARQTAQGMLDSNPFDACFPHDTRQIIAISPTLTARCLQLSARHTLTLPRWCAYVSVDAWSIDVAGLLRRS